MSRKPSPCRREWIAVDGPAGAGKSTLARGLARVLGFRYIDTGATYRAAALAVARARLSPSTPDLWPAITEVVERLRMEIGVSPLEEGPVRMILDGEDVSQLIRSAEVGQRASDVARIPGVRQVLVRLQRRLAEEGPCVMDGRDIGTVVLPEACVKLFVTASLEERASRRARELSQLLAPSPAPGREELIEQLRRRDLQDSSREASPLMAAPDAIILDTTGQDTRQAVARAVEICRCRLRGDNRRSIE